MVEDNMSTIDIKKDNERASLRFRFPNVHPKANFEISFKRTLRVPDDGEAYPLPAGLGNLPLQHIQDYGGKVSAEAIKRGGVLMPMYQSEATWLNFQGGYPVAIKVATGKINAVTGGAWSNSIHAEPQDYMVSPDQDWLDGFCIEKGRVRQFVAEPLGRGETVEEVLTGEAEWGGFQLIVLPMKTSEYLKRFEVARRIEADRVDFFMDKPLFIMSDQESTSMGIAAGGLLEQEIYEDRFGVDVWDTTAAARCFVHLVNSEQYQKITGNCAPHKPITKNDYLEAGIPWFESYKDLDPLSGGNFGALGNERNGVKYGL